MTDDIDPGDGLPLAEVGAWALEKHALLERYVDVTRGVRLQFTEPGRRLGITPQGATYIDVFCGSGRARIRETGALIDGSAIVATTMAANRGSPFSSVYVADAEPGFPEATHVRLAARDIPSMSLVGTAEVTASQIVPKLNPYALHFALLDPFNLDDLPFTVVETFGRLQRIDMLINFSALDLQRNLRRYIGQASGPLDRVAPGWRKKIDPSERDDKIRAAFLKHWFSLIKKLGLDVFDAELITGPRNQRLYWLVMVARNPMAGELWAKINNVSGQGRLF